MVDISEIFLHPKPSARLVVVATDVHTVEEYPEKNRPKCVETNFFFKPRLHSKKDSRYEILIIF